MIERVLTTRAELAAIRDLCVDVGLPGNAFPSLDRMVEMSAASNEIAVGYFDPAEESRLVGATIFYPLADVATTALRTGQWSDGSRITVSHLAASAADCSAIYVSLVVARDDYRLALAAAVSKLLDGSRPRVLARPHTDAGRRISHKLGLAPVGPGSPIWEKHPLARGDRGRPHWNGLARFDTTATAVSRLAQYGLLATIAIIWPVAIVLLTLIIIFSPTAFQTLADGSGVASIAPVLSSASATLGGLATTIFFLTAQLKVAGIGQHGISALYRVRNYLPVLGLTGLSVLLAISALSLNSSPGYLLTAADVLMYAVVTFLALLLVIIFSSLLLMANMDAVTVARSFVARIKDGDAAEWGLVTIADENSNDPVVVNSHRKNFGLRDPLMPFHELIEATESTQRYGRLLSVLAGRVAVAYRTRWPSQFPDPEEWQQERPSAAGRFLAAVFDRAVPFSSKRRTNRIQLVVLILHYFRRVHSNRRCTLRPDARRQDAQFVISRLASVLAQARVSKSPSIRSEVVLAIDLCLDAIACIGADFAVAGGHSDEKPFGQREALRAVVSLGAILHDQGFADQAERTCQLIAWFRENAPAASEERIGDIVRGPLLPPALRVVATGQFVSSLPVSKFCPWPLSNGSASHGLNVKSPTPVGV